MKTRILSLIIAVAAIAPIASVQTRAATVDLPDLSPISTDLDTSDLTFVWNAQQLGRAAARYAPLAEIIALAGNNIVITSSNITNGTIVNADINASAAIALSKLATDPLARANHTGAQLMSTISDAGGLATQSSVALTSQVTGQLPVANGGTGSSTASAARSALGLTIGMDVLAPNGVGSALTALNAGNISSGTLDSARLATSGATAGSYTNADITIDNKGRVTAASNGSGGGGGGSAWAVKTANYTASAGDRIAADTTAGSWSLNLPASPANGAVVEVTAVSDWGVTGTLTVDTAGTELIDGNESIALADASSVIFVWDDTSETWRHTRSGARGGQLFFSDNETAAVTAGTSGVLSFTNGASLAFSDARIGATSGDTLAFFGATPTSQPSTLTAATIAHFVAGGDTVDILNLQSALDDLGRRINAIKAVLETLGLVAP